VNAHNTPDNQRLSVLPWLGWGGLALAAVGYWEPWVGHKSAALVIIGLDLGEFVKFLPQVRAGTIGLQREAFYLPVVALSLILTFLAYRSTTRLGWKAKLILSAIAIAVALAMLPPAWSPASLRAPEFRLLTTLIALCVIVAFCGPLWSLLPSRLLSGLMAVLALCAVFIPLWQFYRTLPAIQIAYGHPLALGWGPVAMGVGWLCLAAAETMRLFGLPRFHAMTERIAP
jgi:hypothetical protein